MIDEDDLDRRIDAALQAQRAETARYPVADTTMWLSHHWPFRYDRCVVVAGRHVCRRCLVLYPVALATTLLAAVGVRWPDAWDVWMFWLLPIPGVVEFSLEALGVIGHRPRRQVAVTALLAVAYGKILWRYVHDPGNALVWAVVLTNTGICGIAALIGAWRRRDEGGEGPLRGAGE